MDGFFKRLEKLGGLIPEQFKKEIINKLNEKINYTPKIGVFGKTGVGKSSMCNAIFGEDVCPISDVQGCTREPQEVMLSIEGNGLKLLDVPGVGENSERDKEYHDLYESLMPELDLILWVLKADDRAFSSDEQFFKKLIRPYIGAGKPFLIVINQVDKIEPFREWDVKNRRPAGRQAVNIEEKHKIVAGTFGVPLDKVLTVSANESYRLVELVDAIIHALPNDQKFIVLDKIKSVEEAEVKQAKLQTEQAEFEARKAEASAKKARAEAEKAVANAEKAKAKAEEAESRANFEKLIQAKADAEIAKAKVEAEEAKAREKKAQAEAEEARAREKKSRSERVSEKAEKEANSGFWETASKVVASVVSGISGWLKSWF